MSTVKKEPKKGAWRSVVKIQMEKDYSAMKKGNVYEVHPVMAQRLLAKDVAKEYTEPKEKVSITATAK